MINKKNQFTYFPPTSKQFYFSTELLLTKQYPLLYVPLTTKAKWLWKLMLSATFFRKLFTLPVHQLPKTLLEQISLVGNSKEELFQINIGTTGPEQKTTIIKHKHNQHTSFYKIGKTNLAKKLIENEYQTLSELNGKFYAPKVISFNPSVHYSVLETTYIMAEKLTKTKLNESVLQVLLDMANYKKSKENELLMCFSHGDFCPWNILHHQQQYYIIDWEMAAQRPLGYDLFTFIFQTSFLLTPQKKITEIRTTASPLVKRYFKTQGIDNWLPYLQAFANIKLELETAKNNQYLITYYQQLKTHAEKA